MMVYETGAAEWIALALMGRMGDVPAIFRPFLIVPILIALAASLALDPWTLAGPAAFTSSLAFILVTESPTNVIPYSSGYFSIRDMAKAGIVMTFFAAICVAVSILVMGAFE